MGCSVVLTVGDELLAGRVTDTNATWLSARLSAAGFPTVHRETVPDEVGAIAAALGRALSAAPVVLVTGGLGPTADDLTRDGVALGLGRPLEEDGAAWDLIREFFERHGREAPARDRPEARLPRGAQPLRNRRGTAPGFTLDVEGALVVVLPGVPTELEALYEDHVAGLLAGRPDRAPAALRREFTIRGLPEARLGELVQDLMRRGRNPSIGSYPRTTHVVLVAEALAESEEAARALLDADEAELRRRLGEHVLGTGVLRLEGLVAEQALARGTRLAVAESLTGGLVAESLVSVPGISAVFMAGFVTYSDASKRDVLGVPAGILERDGAVSEACARAMAEGARRLAEADVAVSTTGIAGPTGATHGKPIGTVWVGLATREGARAACRVLVGDRAQVRERAAWWALDTLYRALLEVP